MHIFQLLELRVKGKADGEGAVSVLKLVKGKGCGR